MNFTFTELTKIDQLRIIHLGVSCFGAVAILLIWNQGQRITKDATQEGGLLFLSFAFLLWGAIDFYRLIGVMKPGEVSLIIKTFSVYNNAFFIAALPFFNHGFERVKQRFVAFRTPATWTFYTLVTNVFIALLYSISWGDGNLLSDYIKYFDVLYSVITLGLVGYGITMHFYHLQNIGLTILGILLTIGLILPQFAFLPFIKISHFDTISVFILLTHTFLVMAFLLIAQTWLWKKHLTLAEAEKVHANDKSQQLQREVEKRSLQSELQDKQIRLLESQMLESKIFKMETEKSEKLQVLSDREAEVLKHIGKSYSEIGNLLFISRDTVITHKKNIEIKLGISGKENLILFAKDMGLIEKNT